MLVNRRTFITKRGRTEEAAKFLKEAMQLIDLPRPPRVYVCELGPFDTIAVEVEEGESLADYERRGGEWSARTTPEFWEKWFNLTENGGANEIWRLVD
jgi:hypothetical protein